MKERMSMYIKFKRGSTKHPLCVIAGIIMLIAFIIYCMYLLFINKLIEAV